MKEKYMFRRLLKGLCKYCGKHKFIPNTYYCSNCRKRIIDSQRRLRNKRRSEGKCLECDVAVSKYKKCAIHRRKDANAQRARYKLQKERTR